MNYSEIVSFIWGVADLIRDTFKRGKYQDVILPLTVLRRLDCVLAPTKEHVLETQAKLKDKKLENLAPQLRKAAGFAFYNTSRYDFDKLLADAPHLAANLRNYIAGFSHIHPEYARSLVTKGLLVRSGRGLYVLADSEITEFNNLAIIGKRVPKGVICLTSALRFHNIGTQLPRKVWLALQKGSAQPRLSYPPVSIVRLSGQCFSEGINTHEIEGVTVKIYNPAKTVADCFKFRNRIGLEAAIEAARECLREKKTISDEVYHYAKICRVWNIMKPYMEALSYC